jgi:hypothetical protein
MNQTLNRLFTGRVLTFCLAMLSAFSVATAAEPGEQVSVNVDNFVRAESDHMIRANMKGLTLDLTSSLTCGNPLRRTTSRRSV